jgi:hypothetical protein
MAIVIVSHRALNESSRLGTILAKAACREVIEVTDGMLSKNCEQVRLLERFRERWFDGFFGSCTSTDSEVKVKRVRPCHLAGSVTRKSPLPGKSIQVMSPSLSLFPNTGSPPIEVTWTGLVSPLKVSMFLPKA